MTAPAASAPGGAETFRHIPSAKQLYELLVASRTQLAIGWSQWGRVEATYMARLWGFLSAVARASVRRRTDADGAAQRLLDGWEALDKEAGSPPGRRGWSLPPEEADERQNLIEAYLVDAGPTSLMETEPDSPVGYLSDEEDGR